LDEAPFARLAPSGNKQLFRTLCALRAELVALHLLESPKVENFITTYPAGGDHLVAKGYPKYKTPDEVAALLRKETQEAFHSERAARKNVIPTEPAEGGRAEESRRENNGAAQGETPRLRPPAANSARGDSAGGSRVYINSDQFFEGVPPEVWAFQIGGYQVAEKWLKDRRNRRLSLGEINHYQKIIVSLSETIRRMAEVDAAIPSWPIS